MENDKDFENIYENLKNKYLQEVEDLRLEEENIRKKNIKLNLIILICGIALIFLVLIITLFTNNSNDVIAYMYSNVLPPIGIIIFGTFLAFIFIPRPKISKVDFRTEYKQKIIKSILDSFNENVEYFPRKGIDESDYSNAEFEDYDLYFSEDLMTGKLSNGCNFSFAEVNTRKYYEDLNNEKRVKDIFEGAFAKIETPKPFKTILYLRKDLKDKNLLTKFSSLKLDYKDLRVGMDSNEFEQLFDIYCTDKIIAMQLLTADIMQLLVKFKKEMHNDFELTIKDDNIYIRLKAYSLFDVIDKEKSIFDKVEIYRHYEVLKFIFSLTNNLVKLLKETQYNTDTTEND